MSEILLDREETARRLSLKADQLFDRRYLARLRLRRVKIGRLVRFRSSDVERVIQRGLEPLPVGNGD